MDKIKELQSLKEKMAVDKTLPKYEGATRLVFGDGNVNATVMCVGEGPGYWEDQKGSPFVGNAGALLNRLLSLAHLTRESGFVESGPDTIFITNVVHYRPPGNRDPLPEEIAAFAFYLDRMLEIINPKVIVTLGRFSMAKFLPTARISSVHGKKFVLNWKGRNILVIPMYHPAAALRSGAVMEASKSDFAKLSHYLSDLDKLDKLDKKEAEPKEEKQVKQMNLI